MRHACDQAVRLFICNSATAVAPSSPVGAAADARSSSVESFKSPNDHEPMLSVSATFKDISSDAAKCCSWLSLRC